MTRQEILALLLDRAQANGFNFRKWFEARIEPSWTSSADAVNLLARGRRYYALLFSHQFARCFWKQGSQISFVVPASSYIRRNTRGQVVTIKRKAFTRRTLKADAWKYHLREMVAQEEPLHYIRRFLVPEEPSQHFGETPS